MKERECKIELKIAEEGDFHGIVQVILKHSKCPPIYFRPAIPPDPVDVAQSEKSIFFVAKVSKEVVGYLKMHSEKPLIAELEMVVEPDYRDCRIGTKLLMYAIQHAKEKTKLRELRGRIKKGNDASTKLCENNGFRELLVEQMGTVWVLEMIRLY